MILYPFLGLHACTRVPMCALPSQTFFSIKTLHHVLWVSCPCQPKVHAYEHIPSLTCTPCTKLPISLIYLATQLISYICHASYLYVCVLVELLITDLDFFFIFFKLMQYLEKSRSLILLSKSYSRCLIC